MKILHVNYSDISGGAARAAYRLHCELLEQQVCSQVLVHRKSSDDSSVVGPTRKRQKLLTFLELRIESMMSRGSGGQASAPFSTSVMPGTNVAAHLAVVPADLVNLNWTCGGMLRIEALQKITRPIVWTLHDMWPFTGGCHYADSCERYRSGCGNCPVLARSSAHDLSQRIFERKAKAYLNLDLTIVAPSHWMAENARSSKLFSNLRIQTIHNGLDLGVFKPVNKRSARQQLGLPENRSLILFGAMDATNDHRKGFDLLLEGLDRLSEKWRLSADLVIFGSDGSGVKEYSGFNTHFMGQLGDEESLARLYSAASLMIVPSRQDNLPNTVSESLACGTPVVAFSIGGLPDMVEHRHSGYLAAPYDPNDLARGIELVLKEQSSNENMSRAARKIAEEKFSVQKMAQEYQSLYKSVIGH